MPVSRRSLLRGLGATLVGSVARPLAGRSLTEGSPPLQCGVSLRCPILLDRNENPYGPPESVAAILRDAASLSNRYPRTEHDVLISKIALLHAVEPPQVAIGCGSSEILWLAAREFLTSGKRLVQASPTCPLIGKFARSVGAEVVDVPLTKTYEHDLDAMLARAKQSPSFVYICNPNNPTGTLTTRTDIEAFIRKLPAKTMVLVDEAYHHFAGPNGSYASFLDEPIDDSRIMVVRTFSKIYGLAGMRVGYMVAAPDIVHRLAPDASQIGISVISAKVASAAIDDSEYVTMATKRNADDRQEFMNQVNARFLHALDSRTNFAMLDPMRPTDEVVKHFKDHNIIVGPIISEMPKYVRVSLGTAAEMEEFWRVLDLMPGTGKMVM